MNRHILVLIEGVLLVVLACTNAYAFQGSVVNTAPTLLTGATGCTCDPAHKLQERPVFGPQTFTKDTASTQEFQADFSVCNHAASYTVIVQNGDANGDNKATGGSIFINGSPVVYERDFANGFSMVERVVTTIGDNNSVGISLDGGAAGSTVTVTVEGYRKCIGIQIDGPGDGTVVYGNDTLVYGTIDLLEGNEAGVSINGVPAEVNGTYFALAGLPLADGPNDIVAYITDNLGNTSRTFSKVTAAEQSSSYIRLTPYPASGTAPLDVNFSVYENITAAGTHYELDFDGDGIADVTAPDLDTLTADADHTYDIEGLYYPTLTVTDADGGVYYSTAVVNVYEPPDLAGKWGAMKAALVEGRISDATGYMAESSRDAYKQVFQAFANEGVLMDMASGMGDIQITNYFGDYAEGDMRVMQDGVEYSFYVLFEKGADGVWRIKSF